MEIAISVSFGARIVFDSSKWPGEEWYMDSAITSVGLVTKFAYFVISVYTRFWGNSNFGQLLTGQSKLKKNHWSWFLYKGNSLDLEFENLGNGL